jgi:hypothetical protein
MCFFDCPSGYFFRRREAIQKTPYITVATNVASPALRSTLLISFSIGEGPLGSAEGSFLERWRSVSVKRSFLPESSTLGARPRSSQSRL